MKSQSGTNKAKGKKERLFLPNLTDFKKGGKIELVGGSDMPKSVFEQIKKQNGERFAKAIRGYDNGIFDIPGIVDIVKYAGREAEPIMEYLESLKEIHIEETGVYQDPLALLDAAGYDAYYVTNLKEQNRIQKYYAKGEELCTFSDPDRFKQYHIINAVRKDVDQIKREDFRGKEKREDEYGTSVLSIQILKTGGFISIKNRYNHTVENPDNTFGSNPDRIIPGLSNALRHHFGTDFSAQKVQLPRNYTIINNQIICYNYEKDNIYFGPNFYIKEGKIHHLESHEIMLGSHIFDLRTKELNYPGSSRTDGNDQGEEDIEFKKVFLKEIEGHMIILKKGENGQHLFIHKEGEKDPLKDVEILSVKDGYITSLNLPTTTEIGNSFLQGNRGLKSLNAPKLISMGNFCFPKAHSLVSLRLPSLEKCGNNCFVFLGQLESLELPKLKQMGNTCFEGLEKIEKINLPVLSEMGRYCFYSGPHLKSANLPCLKIIGSTCFCCTNVLKSFYAPLLEDRPQHFCREMNPLKRIILWSKRKIPLLESGISAILHQTQQPEQIATDSTSPKGISAQLTLAEKEKTDNPSFFKKLRDWLLPQK